MRLELYYDSTVEPFRKAAFNHEEIFKLINMAKSRGIGVTIIDTANWDISMLYEIYLRAVIPSVQKRYRIRKVFGTARDSGRYFGRQIPALLVYEDDRVLDVYPHEEGRRITPITEFLEGLLVQPSGGECDA